MASFLREEKISAGELEEIIMIMKKNYCFF